MASIWNIMKMSALIAISRKKIPTCVFARHNAAKFLKGFKSRRLIPNYLCSSFLSGLFLVKALPWHSKTDKSVNFIKEVDSLYDQGQFEQLLLVLNGYRTSEDPEILWRLARAIFEKCRNINSDKDKAHQYEEALRLVDQALQINEQCSAAHKWRAILMDYVYRYKGTKERIIHSFDVKKHMERAVELNPEDATSIYLIGEWCFTFAEMPWYKKNVAAVIFATPPTSTYEEALGYFEKAEKVSPLFYSMNLLMLGKCHLGMNNKEKATFFLKQARDYPIKTEDDQKAKAEAEKLLKGL